MSDTTVQELNEQFAVGGEPLGADVMAELQSILRLYQLSPLDLFFKWESYCLKLDREDSTVSLDALRALKQDMQDQLEKSSRTQAHVKSEKRHGAVPRRVNKGNDVFGILEGIVSPAPGIRPNKTSSKKRQPEAPRSEVTDESVSKLEDRLRTLGASAIPPSSFSGRANAGEIVEILNEHLPRSETPMAPSAESRIKLTAASDQKKLGYKIMAMKLSEASEILDDRIDDFMNLIMEHHKLDDSVFGSAAIQSTADMIAVGRIASDSTEGKLNAASLVLESSRRMGGGLRIHLDVSRLRGYHFFPGQIVALRGSNASGHAFTVDEVLGIPILPNAASSPDSLEAHRQRLRGGPDAMDSSDEPQPLNILLASGPYTADDNLDFEPLHTLCGHAADSYVDTLILCGPFIDSEHPLIATGDFDLPQEAAIDADTANMNSVFKYMISPALNRLVASNPHMTILLVPSVRDMVAKHTAWPQDAFSRRDLGLPKTARIVGNPMTLSINESVVAISSQDVLSELRHEELTGGSVADTNLLSRLSRYLIEQRHFFPLFPPADRRKLPKTGTADGIPPGAMLDVSYLKLGEMIHVRPDVLLVPSALPPFARVVESVVVINPGCLSKRRGAGTYASMTLYPPKLMGEETGGMIGHAAFERARVEIKRI